MMQEKSCGAVVYTKNADENLFLLIRSKEGLYGFPKGHVEKDETEVETALREVREEVGLYIELRQGFRMTDTYRIPQKPDTVKEVVYFLGFYDGQIPVYQKEELTGAFLFPYGTAMTLLPFESSKRILKEANKYLMDHKT